MKSAGKMEKQIVTVTLELDQNQLYFDGLGEMLSRHVSELCSKGNFGHEFAAGIYRTLADKLSQVDFDSSMSDIVREGFETTMFGEGEDQVKISISSPIFDEDFGDFGNDAWGVDNKFRRSEEGRRMAALFEKYGRASSVDDTDSIEALRKIVAPNREVFQEAERTVRRISEENGFRVKLDREQWRAAASLDEIMQDEDKIVFLHDVLSNYYLDHLFQKCFRYCATVAELYEIEEFRSLALCLPNGFIPQRIMNRMASFPSWVASLRTELEERLRTGMHVEDIKKFSESHDLASVGVNIKNRIDHLISAGIATKGKRNGRVFYSM